MLGDGAGAAGHREHLLAARAHAVDGEAQGRSGGAQREPLQDAGAGDARGVGLEHGHVRQREGELGRVDALHELAQTPLHAPGRDALQLGDGPRRQAVLIDRGKKTGVGRGEVGGHGDQMVGGGGSVSAILFGMPPVGAGKMFGG